jgi:methionyl-tRNA synthetase
VRYVVLREIPFDRDGDVTAESLVRRYNAELANDLGNLVNRTISMANRYLDGALPAFTPDADADVELRTTAERVVRTYRSAMERLRFDEALAAVMDLADAANGYVESQAPWALNKAGDDDRVAQVLVRLAEACRILGHLVAPFTPATGLALLEQLGAPAPYDDRGIGGPGLDTLLVWGSGPEAWRTATARPLFPRIEVEEAVS